MKSRAGMASIVVQGLKIYTRKLSTLQIQKEKKIKQSHGGTFILVEHHCFLTSACTACPIVVHFDL